MPIQSFKTYYVEETNLEDFFNTDYGNMKKANRVASKLKYKKLGSGNEAVVWKAGKGALRIGVNSKNDHCWTDFAKITLKNKTNTFLKYTN